jgi:hypothetical protein
MLAAAGLAEGHASKLLAPTQLKRLGRMSLGSMLGALGFPVWRDRATKEDWRKLETLGRSKDEIHTMKILCGGRKGRPFQERQKSRKRSGASSVYRTVCSMLRWPSQAWSALVSCPAFASA